MAAAARSAVIISVVLILLANVSTLNIAWKSNDSDVYVIDGVFAKHGKVIKDAVKILTLATWKFTVDEIHDTQERKQYTVGFITKSKKVKQLLKAPRIIQKVISKIVDSRQLFINEVQGRIIERGDFSPVITDCSRNSSRYLALLILSKKWQRNDYGEIVVYGRNGDILRSIHPKFGRVVLFTCGLQFKISPPCINKEARHYLVFTEFGHESSHETANDNEKQLGLSKFIDEKCSRTDENIAKSMDIGKLITKRIYTRDGKGIFIFDNAIPSKYVDALREYIHNHAEYHESPIDDKGADNVKWIISLDDPGFVDGPIWNIIKQLLLHATGKEYFPYDLACNHVRRTDNTYMHKDNYYDFDEYTILIYLNKDWRENDYGETTFFDNNEIIAALRPRYGRVAIFHGTIDHSAHPASPAHHGARYTFAIKTAASKELALGRIFQEELSSSYEEVMSKLEVMEANGDPKQKKLARTFINLFQSGRFPGSNAMDVLRFHLLKNMPVSSM